MFNRLSNHHVPTGLLMYLFVSFACLPSISHGKDLLGQERARAVRETLIGEWVTDIGKEKINLRLTSHGRFFIGSREGEYTIDANTLKLRDPSGEVGYQFDLAGDLLTLSGGDLTQALKFSKKPEMTGFLGGLFNFSHQSAILKAQRIGVICGFVLVSILIIALLRALSHFLIYSDWGPLRYLFTHHKNRVRTIHSLVLNALKYVIYFTAFGFMLSEIGINYKTYLASLSVIGLAIGFGSQGLVQDMVTGFFLIFEGQFDVGDMVEISGQTGIVEGLGLRVTKLRSYLGQFIVIPNRNIALVGNYIKGALQAYVDVAMADTGASERCAQELQNIGEELCRQFDDVIMTHPKVLGPVSLQTGEHFIRMYLNIWPQQQWVIEQQLVPRIREIFKNKGFEIPGDRIIAFYHIREEQPVTGWQQLLKRSKRAPTDQF